MFDLALKKGALNIPYFITNVAGFWAAFIRNRMTTLQQEGKRLARISLQWPGQSKRLNMWNYDGTAVTSLSFSPLVGAAYQ
jgi:hypothetical protein